MERRADWVTQAEIFDPLEGPSAGWPVGSEPERAYLRGFGRHGAPALISNLRTRIAGLRYGERIFPLTINEAEYGDAYVCLPHSAYALYAQAELKIVDAGPWSPALSGLAGLAGLVMRAAEMNRVVHLNNWMLSTNLHGPWKGEGLGQMLRLLVGRFPDHWIAVRSLNPWSDPDLLNTFRREGWTMLPSRQVYVTDDLERDWAPRRNTRRDAELLARSPHRVDFLETLRPGDCERIAELYAMLYLDRYSRLNPAFTSAFIDLTHREKIFSYRALRTAGGVIVAVVGCLTRGGVLTTPIVGYDTDRPKEEGLYRMASILFARMALERGVRLNGSAGAAGFKRGRGARPVIEYSAFHGEHLTRPRRLVIQAMEHVLRTLALPLMLERGL